MSGKFIVFLIAFSFSQAWAVGPFAEELQNESTAQERSAAKARVNGLLDTYLLDLTSKAQATPITSEGGVREKARRERTIAKLRLIKLLKLTLDDQDFGTTVEFFKIKIRDSAASDRERQARVETLSWELAHLVSAFNELGFLETKHVEGVARFFNEVIYGQDYSLAAKKAALIAQAQVAMEASHRSSLPPEFWGQGEIVDPQLLKLHSSVQLLTIPERELRARWESAQSSERTLLEEHFHMALYVMLSIENGLENQSYEKLGLRQFAQSAVGTELGLNEELKIPVRRGKSALEMQNHRVWSEFVANMRSLLRQAAFEYRHMGGAR